MHAWPREGIFIHVRRELRWSRVGISACMTTGGREGVLLMLDASSGQGY